MSKQCVALNYASHTHYNDHLAPISVVMDIPLVVVETVDYDICKKYYPDVKVEITEYYDFNPEYLISHYEVLFMSDLWDRHVLKDKFLPLEAKYGKIIRNVHVPHGFSDKGFYLRKAANEDITLIYGQNMLDMFRHEGVLQNLHQYVLTGNYRYTYFKMHEPFYDSIMQNEILNKFGTEKKIILYAPTWMDLEESSTYFECIDNILTSLPEHYNIIVKPHPQLEMDDTAAYYQTLGKYQDHPQILFLTDFPLIYPLLKYTDIYIGDMSSIGYDFLIFDRPMFFLNKENRNPKRDRRSFLFNCGVDVKKNQIPKIFEIIEKNLPTDKEKFSNIRAETWEYTFGKEKSFSSLRTEINEVLNTPIDEASFFHTPH